ncbi:DEAD/DEAH box helicase [Corynebacterium testudinoris]|uniref:Helicase/secretion neighborhood putative DEAH-box helicase n=1 Tax=Corynebacterium testudinoris TaxID=136857 RepID=A0A0G3H2V4_9CORY|nr:DEAD/DEAH box helicase [Corynebacterium testudinoris]AKK07719.1 helicase/secretion neighborhood putative DEAH-box helicase [Corynebacterium testudinoris]MBX8995831.1 DEAD/DEAH box helicase [Corynebacterium testudinoris]
MVESRSVGAELSATIVRRFPASTCTYATTIGARHARHAQWPLWVHPDLKNFLNESEITDLYSHQAECAQLAWEGHDVVVATGTSSGKSLGYQLPILSALAEDQTATALYLTPTKALGSDQLAATSRLTKAIGELRSVHPAPYDGDTPTEARAGIRDATRFVFTNPDMLHVSILAHHQRWARLLRHLKFIVIDECHTYRGVFGANVALVMRRLLRIASHYGAHPTVILASATAADPAAHAANLLGRPVRAVTEDGAPTGERTVMLWEPGFIEGMEGENGAPVRRAATTESADIMATLVAEGARTLTFVRSRRSAELVALRTAEDLSGMGRGDFAARIAAYRAGYLAEDRRRLERQLDSGELLGVSTTNALELGIDVGGLDAVVTAGFPGTVASFWQQAGRAGRRGQGSLVVLVARDEPMDTYLVHHPDALLGRPVENSVFNPHNPYVLLGHVYCAAVEKPLTVEEVDDLGAQRVVDELTAAGLLRRRPRGWFAVPILDGPLTPESAHSSVSLRGGSGEEVMIVDMSDGRLLGTIDSARAPAQVHPGAVYLHQGESFVIEDLDLENFVALARPEQPDYTTIARTETDIRILSQPGEDELVNYSPGLWVANVEVEVTDRVIGYITKLPDGTTADIIPLDLPEQKLRTRAVSYTIDPLALAAMGVTAGDTPGTLHAAEHAAIGLLPLIATCDRWDIGGVSTAMHVDTQLPTVFVYDGHPGGAGFADEGFARFPEWIEATFEAVRSCTCESGCPSCVQSPKCGNGNSPLDKAGALRLLGALVTMTATPAPPSS